VNDTAFLPFLCCNPSKPVQPRLTVVRIAQCAKPAAHHSGSLAFMGVGFKRLSDEPRIHLSNVHRPFDETSLGFSETVSEETMTWRERFTLCFFFRFPVAFWIVPGNIKADIPKI
jgi:hypothetical protein